MSPEERHRIYLEEKARMEARERLTAERKSNPTWRALLLMGVFVMLSSLMVPFCSAVSPLTVRPENATMTMVLVALLGAVAIFLGIVSWLDSSRPSR